VLGVALAAWGVSFHRLGDGTHEHNAADRPVRRSDPLGAVVLVAVLGPVGYWFTRLVLGRSVTESIVFAAVALGLSAMNRWLDALIARRGARARARARADDGAAGPAPTVD